MTNIYDNEEFFNAYAQMDRSKYGLEAAGEWHQLLPLFPDVKGKAVLDLGCGYGWHCRYAKQMGATEIVGIDSSENMLEEAVARSQDAEEQRQSHNAHGNDVVSQRGAMSEHGVTNTSGIRYLHCDIEDYDYPPSAYDLVISNLVLHYVKDLEAVFQKVWQTLKPGGCFLFNIEHPAFTAGINQDWIYDEDGKPRYWAIDNYYFSGERVTNFLGQKVVKRHRTLTQIVNPLLQMGFQLEALEEVTPPESMMHIPGMKDELRRPMMLLVKCTKRIYS